MSPNDPHAAVLLNTCSVCGDGTDGGNLCTAHENEQAAPPLSARTDNWTAALARKPTRRAPKRNHAKFLAEGWIRCSSCRGHIGKTQHGTPCKPCGRVGWVKR